MKHIRTEWSEVRYTVEFTEEERAELEEVLGNASMAYDLWQAICALKQTHP